MAIDLLNEHDAATFLNQLPKVELHVHLEGAIPLGILWQLAQKYGLEGGLSDVAELESRFVYKDFAQFIDTWVWVGRHLREYEDYTMISNAVANDLYEQGIRYAELMYSPTRDSAKHLNPQRITEAILEGFEKGPDGIKLQLIADIVRDNGPKEAETMVEALGEMGKAGPVGIGIGGSEHLYPPGPYEGVFEKARDFGFHTAAHAGEAAGSESVWETITSLRVERIGHGVRAIEDPDLLTYLIERQIPIELCPTANVRTGIVPNIRAHPLKQFYDLGMKIFLNSDDPKLFNTSLYSEYKTVIDTFNFGLREIRRLTENAVESAWCDTEMKTELKEAISRCFSH